MKIYQILVGIIGYILLVVSASSFHMPILSLLALPVFVVSILVCAVFFFLLPQNHATNKKWFSAFLIIVGTMGLAATIGYSAWQYADYLVAISRNVVEKFYPSPWLKVFMMLGFDAVASSIIVLGVQKRTRWKGKSLFFLYLTVFLSVPITVVLVKLLELSGMPLCT